MKIAQPLLLILTCTPCLITGCGEDNEAEKAAQAARFNTATNAPPNPQRLALNKEIKQNIHLSAGISTAPKYPLYSRYKGEDIQQVTGVSGRKLILAFTAGDWDDTTKQWCPHSVNMRTALRTLAEQEKGNIQVVDINADDYPKLAEEFEITKVPTIFVYSEGIRLTRSEGYYNSATLSKLLKELLGTVSSSFSQ